MSDKEDSGGCHACSDFEPQAWRKSLCRNCFHTLEEHSEELLAKEAEAVAREKAEKASAKSQDTTSKAPGAKTDAGKAKEGSSPTGKDLKGKVIEKDVDADKDKTVKDVKGKFGANKESGKDDGKWSWSKDLGREYGNPSAKAGSQATAATGLKGKPSTTTTASTTSSTTTTTSTSSSPLGSSKSSLKSVTSSSTAPTTTPSTTTTSSTPSSTTTTTSSTATTTSTSSTSKTKNVASKFESKTSTTSKDKPPLSKTPEIRPGGLSVAARTGKLEDTSDSKSSLKLPDTKSADSSTSLGSKTDSKSPWKKSDDSKVSDTASKFSKSNLSKAKDNSASADDKGGKKDVDDSKEKKTSVGKPEEKDSKFSVGSRSKAAPFGKDLLRSTKDAVKKDSSGDEKVSSSKPKEDVIQSKNKDSLKAGSTATTNDKDKQNVASKFALGKFSFDKTKKKEDETTTKPSSKLKSGEVGQSAHASESKLATGASRVLRDTEQTDTGGVNKPGHLAKPAGKTADGKTGERSEGKDIAKLSKGNDDVIGKYQNNARDASPLADSSNVDRDKSAFYRDRGKEKGGKEGESARKSDPAASLSSLTGAKQTPAATTSSTSSTFSKTATPTSPLSPSSPSDSKASSPLFSASKLAGDKKPKDLKVDAGKDSQSSLSPLEKFKGLDKTSDKSGGKESPVSSLKSPSSASPLKKDESTDKAKEKATAGPPAAAKDILTEKLTAQLKEKEDKVEALSKQLSKMEKQVKGLEEEKEQLRKNSMQSQKDDMEKMLKELRSQLSKMETQCSRLQGDNQSLIDKLHVQEESVKRDQACRGKNTDNVVLEEDLEAAEKELEEVKEENKELQRQIMEMKNEMDEMYDHFRENEHDEFRELQKELDMTAKNCRILQFKLRKAERRNDQIEEDRIHYEEKLRMLQDQFDSQDAKNHIRVLEEELRIAKEVSVRLHDELDIVDDKKNKALEENRHLTELLEHTDKRQFRMEMEIDKLRDIVADLKQQLKEAKSGNNNNNNNNNKDSSSPDRKVRSSIYTRSID